MARAPQASEAKSGMKGRRDDDDDDRRSRRDDDAPAKSSKGRRDEDDNDRDADGDEREERSSKAASNGKGRRDDRDAEDDRPAKASAKSSKFRDDDDKRKPAGDDDDDAPINLEDADDSYSREVVPRGKYLTIVDDVEFKTFKSGSKGCAIRLEIIEGDYAKGANGPNGKRKKGVLLFTNLVVSPGSAGILKASLKALGVDKKVVNSPNFRPSTLQKLCDEGDLVGVEVVADVKIGQYEGDKNNQVKRLMAPGSEDKAEGKGSFLED
jgi:hypothetical protein